mmetsp:Transcript_86410/g.244048  ORF Transcript_86410/g.244048 Transcript_86410/m.244048 type:complete len:787 (+) Transcript_86410:50-2410(+)
MADRGNVKVVCRVRPQNQVVEDGAYNFTFDRVFGPSSTQLECFEYVAKPVVGDIMEGYNATIFAYGQTSSGKTHTMEGPSITDKEQRGIIPRTVCELFEGVSNADSSIEFTVKVSYVEIYMERIRDLLDQFHTKTNLSVREDPRQGIYVSGVTEEYTTCEEELLQVMSNGAKNRATAATGMNEGSSRSHSVFMVTVTQRHLETGSTKTGKLFLVDLAGSEMVRKTHASGQQLEEAKTINKSLSALGLVINALTDEKAQHVPYRDSKLTRVLQDSLGGNSKTVLVINTSPSSYNASETLSTCRFGSRAKSITNKPKINEERSVEELSALLQKAENAIDMQQSYILALEGQLRSATGQGGPVAVGGDDGMHNEILALQSKVASLTAELAEEREESTRREREVKNLTAMMVDKEQLLTQAGELMTEAERHCEVHREKVEELEGEKSKLMDEMLEVKEELRDLREKSEFEGQELRLHVEKLKQDNERLHADIDESNKMGAPSAGSSPMTPGMDDASPPPPPVASLSTPTARSAVKRAVAASSAPASDMRMSVEEIEQMATKLELSAEAAEFFRKREEAWFEEQGRVQADGSREELLRAQQEYERHIQEIEGQRRTLAADLKSTCDQKAELEAMLDQAKGGDGAAADSIFSTRERNHMRSLQQRLEQLVAVHRQLLRKYAALELDSAECKKKIALRDERIRQLEANTRAIVSNMRNQAERHASELAKLRDQISAKREDHINNMQMQPNTVHGPRAVRGGTGAQGRSIRGGAPRRPTYGAQAAPGAAAEDAR